MPAGALAKGNPLVTETSLDERVTYAVRTGEWNEGRAILLDSGDFPRSRLGDVAALFRHVHVVDDRGAAAELRAAGVSDVTTQEGSGIGDAIRSTSALGALVVLCAEPAKARKMMTEALAAITTEDGPQLPVAAIMVMRPHRPADGPVCAIAEHSFVSGYGLLLSVLMADRTHRPLDVTVPRRDEYRATHAEVVRSAMELAEHVGVRVDMRTDPLPRSWAIANSESLTAVFCGVLQAKKRSSADADETATAVELLRRASCDVVVVLDHVSIVHGTSVGAQVAKLIGAALVAGMAVTGTAAPAVASPPVAAAAHVQTPKAGKARRARSVKKQSDVGIAPGVAAVSAAANDPVGAEAATDEVATDEAVTDEVATDEAVTDEVATDEAVTDEVATDEVASAAIEMPIEYIAFQVWTDAAGHNHVISTGAQTHPVDVPQIPDWAHADTSQGWIENRAEGVDASATDSPQAQQQKTATKHRKRAHRKATKHRKRAHRKAHRKRAHRKAHRKHAHRKASRPAAR